MLQSEDNLRRARELHRQLGSVAKDAHVFCVESMSFPRNAGSAAKVAMGWGVIAALAEDLGIPVVQSSPQEIKKVLTGAKNASKKEVQDTLGLRYNNLSELLTEITAKSDLDHAYDALAAVVASLDSEVIRMVRKISG